MVRPGPKPGSSFAFPPHDTITEGDAIGVRLSNRPERVWIDKADYDRIIATHGTRAWSWVEKASYVRVRPSTKETVPVARLVLESDGNGCVYYADGDRLNLRKVNLSVRGQRSRYRMRLQPIRSRDQKPCPIAQPTRTWAERPKLPPVLPAAPTKPKPILPTRPRHIVIPVTRRPRS